MLTLIYMNITSGTHALALIPTRTLVAVRDDLETGIQAFVTANLESSNSAWLPVRMAYDMQQKERTASSG